MINETDKWKCILVQYYKFKTANLQQINNLWFSITKSDKQEGILEQYFSEGFKFGVDVDFMIQNPCKSFYLVTLKDMA